MTDLRKRLTYLLLFRVGLVTLLLGATAAADQCANRFPSGAGDNFNDLTILGLIAKLTRFAAWTGLGPACTLELTPARTYRGLESGLTLPGVLQTLNQHGMRPELLSQ